MIGLTWRTIDRLITDRLQIRYDTALVSASNQEVYILSGTQIAIGLQSKSADKSVIDSLLFEETDQILEYCLDVHHVNARGCHDTRHGVL